MTLPGRTTSASPVKTAVVVLGFARATSTPSAKVVWFQGFDKALFGSIMKDCECDVCVSRQICGTALRTFEGSK